MTDMNATTTPTTKTITTATSSSPTPAAKQPVVTLEQLAIEMKVTPRDARMLLRLAAKQKAIYPTLGKEHVARQPWSWQPGSRALAEARKALTNAA
jgi:hypothetical protein